MADELHSIADQIRDITALLPDYRRTLTEGLRDEPSYLALRSVGAMSRALTAWLTAPPSVRALATIQLALLVAARDAGYTPADLIAAAADEAWTVADEASAERDARARADRRPDAGA
jgi:hypothetical protein